MSEYTEPDMCLRCDSPTSLCQCPKSVLDWYEYTEILLAENKILSAENGVMRKALKILAKLPVSEYDTLPGTLAAVHIIAGVALSDAERVLGRRTHE